MTHTPPPHTIPLPNGLFIVFEGLDGSGKTTQCNMLCEALQQRGFWATFTKEPTDGPWGQKLRQNFQTRDLSVEEELELFIRDRKQHIAELIQPTLQQGGAIVQDRYYLSTAAYQGSRGLDPQQIIADHQTFAPTPHRIYILDISPELGIQRITEGRGEQPNAFEQLESLQRCHEIFASINLPNIRRLDGTLAPAELHTQILQDLTPLLDIA